MVGRKYIAVLFVGVLCVSLAENRFIVPKHFPKPLYDFSENIVSSSKIQLGRALFFDPILSADNTISCASCHSPYNAFAHTDHDLSHGIGDQMGTRNAPALFNLAWQKSFMWDGAIHHLDVQPLAPISHPAEMNESMENVVVKMNSGTIYPPLFYSAFGDSLITGERTLKALAQFQLALISASSKYDKVKQGTDAFSEQERSGYSLFLANCNTCHSEPLFSNYRFANNGLPVDTTLNDFGRWMITGKSEDSLRFKVPSLRNLSYSYPYMHDGRFKKLNEVLTHYTTGMVESNTLATELQNPVMLSSNEKADLIAFLLTLNDQEFVFDPNNKFPGNILLPRDSLNK